MNAIIDKTVLQNIYSRISDQEKKELYTALNELSLSEERYRIATENSSDIIVEYDVLNNSVYHTNPRIEKIYDITQTIENAPEYLIKQGVILPEHARLFRELFQKIRDGQPTAECTFQAYTKAGALLWNNLTLTTIYDSQLQPIRAVGILKDITRQREAEIRYENELIYRNAIMKDALLSYVGDLTHNKVLAGVTDLLAEWGVPYTDDYESVLTHLAENLIYREDRTQMLSLLTPEHLLAIHSLGQDKVEIEYRRKTPADGLRWSRCIVYMTDDLHAQCVKAFYYVHDIHETKTKELALQEKAEHDLLTGLYNKGTTEALIKSALEAGRATKETGAFLIIDLDDFKTINDQLGHAFGDAVLSEMAHKVQDMCRKDDIAGRIGGDEFVLYLRGISSREAVETKAQTICDLFHDAYSGALTNYKISGSVGISLLPEQGDTFEQLYRNADLALYAAKSYGKDSFCVYNDKLQTTAIGKLSRAAIDRSAGKTFSENIIEYVFRILYESRDLKRAILAVLELVSNHFDYSRGYIYELDAAGTCCHLSFEWAAADILPHCKQPQTICDADLADCRQRFDRDALYILRASQEDPMKKPSLSKRTSPVLQIQYALTQNGHFKGFVGFDRNNTAVPLEQTAISVLQVVAQMIDVFLAQQHTNTQLTASSIMLQAVADGLDTCTYITDPDTHLLHFVNRSTSQRIPGALPGTRCYESIRGRSAPCSDCPVTHLLESGTAQYRTELSYPGFSAWSRVDASLIQLSDNKKYGLVHCYDSMDCRDQSGNPLCDATSFTQDILLYAALCNSTDNYIYMCDIPKNLYYFPNNMVEEFDLPGQIIQDANPIWGARIHEEERGAFCQAIQDMRDGKTTTHYQEYRAKNKDGNWVWLRCRGSVQNDKNGAPALFAGMVERLGKKGKIDFLSSLPNKYELETKMLALLSDSTSSGVLLLLGLDNFKNINSLYGWEFGDEVIRASAQIIQPLLPKDLQLYRLDGDKFGLFLPDSLALEPKAVFQPIREAFQSQRQCGIHHYYCTISGGYARISPHSPISFYTLFKQAEYALEYAKEEGKNRLNCYDISTMGGKDRRLNLIERLRESADLSCKGFVLYFQPQVSIPNLNIENAEALLRWSHPEYGTVSPAEFIPLLEQTGLIHVVGRWALRQAAMTCLAWRKEKPNFTVNVNLSFLQLQDNTFIPALTEMIQSLGLPPEALHLELTESCIAAGSHSLISIFRELRELGFQIEMDDFGTGYSSLEVLKNAPADVVKIDGAFVKGITTSSFDATFIQFVVALCHSVNIQVCLEGVETWEEYHLVKSMGVDLIQGFLFGRPESRERFETLYLSSTAIQTIR